MAITNDVNAVELDFNTETLIAHLQSTPHQDEASCTVLTKQGQPVAVLQDYETYQRLLSYLKTTELAWHIAETRERMRQLDTGQMKSIPFNQIVAQDFSPITGDVHDLSR